MFACVSLVQSEGAQATLRPFAIISLLVYAIGVPFVFGLVLYVHRREIKADQELLEVNEGGTPISNPQFFVRLRYQQLYSIFRPGESRYG